MRRTVTHLLGAVAALLLVGNVAAQDAAVLEFESPEQEALYQGLVRELRCTVCQNQNLLDSNSGLAHDLRLKVYNQVREGASRDAIIDFMVSRYGDFVLYRPPLKSETFLLWFGPLVFLIVGGTILGFVLRQQRKRTQQLQAATPLDPASDGGTPTEPRSRR